MVLIGKALPNLDEMMFCLWHGPAGWHLGFANWSSLADLDPNLVGDFVGS